MERPSAYIPMDRRQALAQGKDLPSRVQGAALFADISGFTPLAEGLVRDLGSQRGAEELTHYLNLIYDALIAELHRFGGSVIYFSGDAITCWLSDDTGLRGVACALSMQQVMRLFTNLRTPSGKSVSIAVKAAVIIGEVSRYVVGNPDVQLIDVLAGETLNQLALTEHQAEKGEVVIDKITAESLDNQVHISVWRHDQASGQDFAVVDALTGMVRAAPWTPLSPESLSDDTIRPWLLPPVHERLQSGGGEFLAELRPTVALFLRFSGIDYDHDPEAQVKLDTFTQAVQTILTNYQSTLLQLSMGDKGSLLYAAFGAPVAHEDDTVRAMSAALELRQLAQTLDFITGIQIGISQGRTRTGAYGGSMRRTYGVLGDEVNLAARLMQTAVPGQILVSEAAQETVANDFLWESLPSVRVKGKTDEINLFNLLGPKKQQTIRLQEPHYALPMVGRQSELALIEEKIELALQGKGQVIGVYAEAGMGKSRLVAEAIRIATSKALNGYGGECQSYGMNTSYLVWHRIWQGFFGLNPDWSVGEQVQAIEEQLAQINPSLVGRLPLIGTVINSSIPDNDLTQSFDAKLRKTSLEGLLVECLRTRAQKESILLVLEDCHWFDPLSLELLEAITRAIADRPIAIMLAARQPELTELQSVQFNQLNYYTEMMLADFTPEEAESLVDMKLTQLFGQKDEVPPVLLDRIISGAGGNPFYIEELLNFLQDRKIAPDDVRALEALDLPDSLHSLILSRIDQLTENQKSTIKVASVVGRLFKAMMLWGAYPQLGRAENVKIDLDTLSRLDLTPLDTPEPELAYLFKNIITQEVAYNSMPYATRAMLHDMVGGFIEREYRENLDQFVDLLAHHYEHSENEAKKREYLLKAGETAQADYNNATAINYYEKVLSLLRPNERIQVLLRLGNVLELVGRWDEASETYREAMQLAEQQGNRRDKAWAQTATAELLRKQGQYAEASEWLQKARYTFEEIANKSGVGQVLKQAGTVASQQGDHELATSLYEQALLTHRQLGNNSELANIFSNLGIVARSQGNQSAANYLHNESLALRRQIGDRRAIAVSLNNLGNLALDGHDFAQARRYLEEALAIQREVGDKAYIANFLNNLGNVARDQGDFGAAFGLYSESLAINHELGEKWALAYVLEDIGVMAAMQNKPERALRLVCIAAELREEIGAPLSAAEEAKLDRLIGPANQALSENLQEELRDECQNVPLEDAINYALTDQWPEFA
jgi:predicted ATPase/class 3 adenylate cyclase